MRGESVTVLSDRFSSAESFMFFAAGLDAYRDYRDDVSNISALNRAIGEFQKGIERYPPDVILQFYHALMLLEAASVTDPVQEIANAEFAVLADGYANPRALIRRDNLIQAALVDLESYQSQLHSGLHDPSEGLDDWLYLWSEYNRAAAQVHRLSPSGYLAARDILAPYLEPDSEALFQPQSLSMRATSLDLPTFGERVSDWYERLRGRAPIHSADSPRTVQLQDWLRENEADGDYQALRLQMQSLLNLTRIRPMREPESLRWIAGRANVSDLRYEDLDDLDRQLEALLATLNSPEVKNRITSEAFRDLISDCWSQRGHLICAQALRDAAFEPERILAQWSDLNRPLDNATAFRFLALQAPPVMESHLEQAANAFRKALSFQPRWIPAIRNRDEVLTVLAALRERQVLSLPQRQLP